MESDSTRVVVFSFDVRQSLPKGENVWVALRFLNRLYKNLGVVHIFGPFFFEPGNPHELALNQKLLAGNLNVLAVHSGF